MAKPREFTTAPVRAIGDTRLTALDLRCLLVIALHDGMSSVRGTGAGCYAKSATLAERVGTDVTNFSKSLSRLIKLGYVVREAQQSDKRRYTHRVAYGADVSWRDDQQSPATGDAQMVGEFTNYRPKLVGEETNITAEIVGDGDSENGSFPGLSRAQYISLNEEIDFVETSKINSSEEAHFASREKRGGRISVSDPVSQLAKAWSANDRIEVPAPQTLSINNRLGKHFMKLSPAAQLCKLEDAFDEIGRNASGLDSHERTAWANWLLELTDNYAGDAVGHRAQRLADEFALF